MLLRKDKHLLYIDDIVVLEQFEHYSKTEIMETNIQLYKQITLFIKQTFTPNVLKGYNAIQCKYHTMKSMIQLEKKRTANKHQ